MSNAIRTSIRSSWISTPRSPRARVDRRAAKGVKLGNPNLEAAREVAVGAREKIGDDFAASILPVIAEMQATGATSLRAIADALNRRGFKTPRGSAWAAMSVKNVLARTA